jgi:MFS family permease
VVDAAQGTAGTYRRLFAVPVLRRLAAADVCARLPQGMVTLTLLLVVAQHAAMAVAGLALAGYTLGQAVTAPLRGRLADRRGLLPVAAVCGTCYAAALLGLLACSLAHGPAALLIAVATVAGLVNAPLSPGVRSLWSLHAGPGLRQAAFALDAAVFDLAYIAGPVVASALAAGIAPAAALGVLLVLTWTAVGIIGPYGGPAEAGTGTAAAARRPLRSAALRWLLVTAALTNAALSATEVALTAYARHHHALWASGPLLAGVSIGSIAGSLLLGARNPAGRGRGRLPRLLTGYAAGLAVLAAASWYPPLLAVAAPLAGLCLGPTLATLFAGAAAAAPRGGGTEAQAWFTSIMNGGAAAGAALAALAAGRPVLGLALAAAIAAGAAAIAAVAAATARPAGWPGRLSW